MFAHTAAAGTVARQRGFLFHAALCVRVACIARTGHNAQDCSPCIPVQGVCDTVKLREHLETTSTANIVSLLGMVQSTNPNLYAGLLQRQLTSSELPKMPPEPAESYRRRE